MIVIASDNSAVVDELSTLLKQKGDLFSVAGDEMLALSSIRADRASLLIIDAGSEAFNGFSLCRAVREDPALAHLPVLCIIEPTDLGALLAVLDSSADGFLCRPFDLGALSAAIADLQDRQAEGPAQGAVRTQFRISHEGRDYAVTADRRQLLEFLLSSFEAAVRIRKSRDQVQSGLDAEIHSISERLGALTAERDATVGNLHEELEERSRAISRLKNALSEKEQAESLLKTQKDNVAQELKELGAILETTRRSDEEKGVRINALEADLAAAREEKITTDKEHAEEISALSVRLQTSESDLNASQSLVAALRVKIGGLERDLVSVQTENSRNLEKIRAVTGDLTQAIRERDTSREENAGNLEKIQAVTGDLTQAIRERDEARQECDRLQKSASQARAVAQAKEQEVKSALDNLNTGLRSLEDALEQNLRQLGRELAARRELEKQVETLTKERDSLVRDGNESGQLLANIRAELASEQNLRVRVQTESDAIAAERERLQEVLESTYRDLSKAKEENAALHADLAVKDKDGKDLTALTEKCDRLASDLSAMHEAVAGEQDKRRQAEEKLAHLQKASANSEKFLDSAARDIGVLNSALADERQKAKLAEERYASAVKESMDKDREIAALRQELDAVRSVATERGTILIGPQDLEPPIDKAETGSGPSTPAQPASTDESDPGTETPVRNEIPPAVATPVTGQDAASGPLLEQPPSFQLTLSATGPQQPDKDLPQPAVTLPVSPSGQPDEPVTIATDGESTTVPEESGNAGTVSPATRVPPGDLVISRDRWLDITKWAHHTTSVTEEQRKDLLASLMRLSKLVQKGRHLTNRQEQEIRVLLSRVQSLGYRFI